MVNYPNHFILGITKALAEYLEAILPQLTDNWWNELVFRNLSYRQQEIAEAKGISSLQELDLAALLGVLDKNWYEISHKRGLSREDRHFVKEMQTVRNRWAHAEAKGFSVDDIYRDLDTLERFSKVIGAEEGLIEEIRKAKVSLLKGQSGIQSAEPTQKGTQGRGFKKGQIVVLKSPPETKGVVVEVIPGEPEDRYSVFINGEIQRFYASQLQPEAKEEKEFLLWPCQKFHCYLTALQIKHPGISTLYSLNAARVDFIPYQFRPVLKFIRSDRPRLLIADGVGVGKTIEAGLILKELQARREVKSVLIICPRPLVVERKWEIEMRRFEESFIPLDGKTLRFCIRETDREGIWPEQYKKIIMPYSLFDSSLLYGNSPKGRGRKRSQKGLLDLDPPPRFDLVIVDEAHYVRNPNTYSHKAVRFFCDHAEAVLFLTATPIQLGNRDLFVLLNLLRPDLIIDERGFEHITEPNQYINHAIETVRTQADGWREEAIKSLDKAASTPWGQSIMQHSPEFLSVKGKLSNGELSSEERVQLLKEMESLHTLHRLISRTRRRDIKDFTVRKPQTVLVEFTPAQKRLHDNLLSVQAEIFRRLHGDKSVKFMMTTIRRQAASCLYGLVPFLEDILNRHIDRLLLGETDSEEQALIESISTIESEIKEILKEARNLDPADPKLEALKKILRDKQKLPNNKVMVFSSFRHTLSYLYKHLKEDGFRVGLVHGDVTDEDRVELRNRFELDREDEEALDIMLFSEIGSEGLDYQFCDCIVNYDLPWNPMKIEQRIGRIDRWGQKSESIAIFNLITPGTVDADIYLKCLWRIGVFQRALGGSEEILGEISKEIKDIAENFTLSEEERSKKLQQLADNKIRLIQEQEELEQKQMELFGIRLPQEHFSKEIREASSFWLSSKALQDLVANYLQEITGKNKEFILGDKPLKTLRLSQEARSKLLEDLKKLPRQNTPSYREWENWLKGSSPHLPITFEADCASKHPKAAFITPLHPLVKQAALAFAPSSKKIITTLKVKDETLPEGDHLFAIYQWRFYGIREDMVLRPVSGSKQTTERLSELLERAEEFQMPEDSIPDLSAWDEIESHHYDLWHKAREEHSQKTKELARFRRESLTTSHKARIALLRDQLEQATDEKIRRMRQAQIEAAEADYARRIQELEIAAEKADITAQPVAYGVIHICGGEKPNAK